MNARGVLGLGLAAALGAALGCRTVDLGAPPSDVNVCTPGQQFFVSAIWPMFLGNTYGGKHCYDSTCHGLGSSTQMTLTDITAELAALPTPPPSPLPMDVLADYAQAAQQMNCQDPGDSRLILLPEGAEVHGGGALISPTGVEVGLVEMWVTQP